MGVAKIPANAARLSLPFPAQTPWLPSRHVTLIGAPSSWLVFAGPGKAEASTMHAAMAEATQAAAASKLTSQSRRAAILGTGAAGLTAAAGRLEATAGIFGESPNDLVGAGMEAQHISADGADRRKLFSPMHLVLFVSWSGMEAFKSAEIDESIRLFDKAAEVGYPRSLLWQRGLSLYYAERFAEGAKQFRGDAEQNPNDTEEAIWAMLCEARLVGFKKAQKDMLSVGRDPRPVMREAELLFRGTGSEEQLKAAADRSRLDQFYSFLYLGLYAEAKGETEAAKRYITEAVATKYGQKSSDYMAKLAQVHAQLRGWPVKS